MLPVRPSRRCRFTRRFDTFAFSVSVYHDGIAKINGFNINLFPAGQPGFMAALAGE